MKNNIFFPILIIFFALACPRLALSVTSKAELISCNDGDTCRFMQEGQVIKVRLSGIDAPETGYPFAEESRAMLVKLLTNKKIELRCDGNSYDRKTCSVLAEGVDVQKVLVESGLAVDSPKYSNGLYASQQVKAKASKKGMWSLESISSPHCQRYIGTDPCNKNSLYMPN